MKKIFFVFLIIFFACNGNKYFEGNPPQAVKDKIIKYYKVMELKGYKPVSFSEIDTLHYYNGSSYTRLEGEVKHTFYAINNAGVKKKYSHWFVLTIYDDDVVVLPKNKEYFLSGQWAEDKE